MSPQIQALLEAHSDDDAPLTTMDGFDDCIAGICLRYGQPALVIYDHGKVLAKLVEQGMTEEEAVEHFEYNQIGAWVGETTPAFLVQP